MELLELTYRKPSGKFKIGDKVVNKDDRLWDWQGIVLTVAGQSAFVEYWYGGDTLRSSHLFGWMYFTDLRKIG